MVTAGNLVRANDRRRSSSSTRSSPIYVVVRHSRGALPELKRYHGTADRCASRRRRPATTRPPAGRPHHLRRQRGRSDDRHDQGQGDVPQRGPPAVARAVRQRRRSRSTTESGADRRADGRRADRASRASTSSSSRPDQTVELRPVDRRAHGRRRDRDRQRAQRRRDRRHRRPAAARCRAAASPSSAAARRKGGVMNLAELFIRRPVTTTLIMLGIVVFGVMAYRAAAGERPADRRLPDHPGQRQPARRQPRDDGLGRGAAAREAVRDDRRRSTRSTRPARRAARTSRCSST